MSTTLFLSFAITLPTILSNSFPLTQFSVNEFDPLSFTLLVAISFPLKLYFCYIYSFALKHFLHLFNTTNNSTNSFALPTGCHVFSTNSFALNDCFEISEKRGTLFWTKLEDVFMSMPHDVCWSTVKDLF